ncbi:MAG TPA: phosphotransferase [Bacilli bacterium]|nr:phosphotransferase [Bacilli bacterium]
MNLGGIPIDTKLLLESYHLSQVTLLPIPSGMMNKNFRVQAGDQTYVLKSFATHLYPLADIHHVCAVQERVRQAGVPVPELIRNREGEWITQTEDGFCTLSRFVAGQPYKRPHVPAPAAYAMGQTLGKLQRVMADIDLPATPYQLPDAGQALERFKLCLNEAEKHRANPVDDFAYRFYRERIATLEALSTVPSLANQRQQWQHGDYQETNLIFSASNQVVAIIDFDHLRFRPRLYEMMRCFRYVFYEKGVLLPEAWEFYRGYLDGQTGLTEAEVADAMPMFDYYQTASDWPFSIRYLQPDKFDPRWEAFFHSEGDWWERNSHLIQERMVRLLQEHRGIHN